MRTLCWFSFPFAAGVAAAMWLPGVGSFVLLGLLAAGFVCALLTRRVEKRGRLRAACLGAAVGVVWMLAFTALHITPVRSMLGREAEMRLTVHDAPQRTAYGCAMTVRFREDGKTYRATLYLSEEGMDLRPGDTVRGFFLCRPFGDTAASQVQRGYAKGLIGTLRCTGDWTVQRPEQTPLRELPARVSLAVRELDLFPEDVRPLFHALLVGDRSGLSYSRRNAMSVAGIYHAVAVSGMHVSVLLGFLTLLTGGRRKLRALLGIPVLTAFLLLVGGTPGVVRAVVLCSLALLAPLCKREADGPTSLAFGLLLLQIQNPYAIAGISLQLSFLSVTGLMLFAEPVQAWILARTPKKWRKRRVAGKLIHTAAASISATLCATALTLPLSAYYFGVISLIAPLCNLLLLWAVTVCFAGGIVACLFGFALHPVGVAAGWVLAWPARLVFFGASLASRLPFAAVYLSSRYVGFYLVYLYVILGLCLASKPGQRRWLAVFPAAAMLGICLLLGHLEVATADFSFSALDVGEGQSLLLCAGGRSMLIDCGGSNPDEAGERAARQLHMQGTQTLNALVLTHFDTDHCMGVPQLLERVSVQTAFVPPGSGENYRLVLDALHAAGTEIYEVQEDLTLELGGGTVTLFAPRGTKSSNDSGLAVLTSFDGYDMLATGDMKDTVERQLLVTAVLPDIEILVVGHHGSATSTSTALLQAVRPELAIISVGKNPYGHPREETLGRLRAAGVAVYRTDQCGTVTVRR